MNDKTFEECSSEYNVGMDLEIQINKNLAQKIVRFFNIIKG